MPKLNIYQDVAGTAISGSTSNQDGNTFNHALYTLVQCEALRVFGIYTECSGTSEKQDIALYGYAKDGTTNYGIYGDTNGQGTPGNPGSGNWAGMFYGDVGMSASGTYFSSDSLLKKDIEPLADINAQLMQLRPVSFYFVENDLLNLSAGIQYGFVAQEVAEVFPSLVREVTVAGLQGDEVETLSHLALNQTELVPLLVQGVKEHGPLMDQAESLINEVNDLLEQLTINSETPNTQEDENE